jgi:hypothetical protein
MSGALIQAINRVACRQVIDAEGNCPPVEVYITLPGNKVGREMQAAVFESMPGAQRVSWGFKLDREMETTKKPASDGRFLEIVRSLPPGGRVSTDQLREELGLGRNTLKDLIKRACNTEHQTGLECEEMGVAYKSKMGRGAMPYFVKAA